MIARLAILFSVLFWCGTLWAAPDTVTLRLPPGHPFLTAGFVAAQQQGFYQEKGLVLRLDTAPTVAEPLDDVVFGKAEYALAGSEIMDAWAIGKPVISLAVYFQKSAEILITKGDITIPSQLIHRRISLPSQKSLDIRAMLASKHIPLDSLVIVSSSNPLQDFIDGRIDAFVGAINDEPERLLQAKVDFNVIRPDQYGVDFYGLCLLTSRYELAEHPERAIKFVDASNAGWVYASKHLQEFVEYFAGNSSENVIAHLQFEAQAVSELFTSDRVRMGEQDLSIWQEDLETLQGFGLAPASLSVDSLVQNTDQIVEDRKARRLERAILVAGIAFALALVLSVLTWLFWRGMTRRNAEFRQSEVRLQQALRATPDAVWELTDLAKPMWWSPGAFQLFGLSEGNFEPTWNAMLERVVGEDRNKLMHEMQNVLSQGGSFACEVRIYWESSTHWLRIRGLASDGGSPRKIFGYFQDIHEMKATGLALRDSEARFRQYFELGLVGMATVNPQGRFIQVNRTLWELLDSSEAEMSQKEWRDFTHPGDLGLEEELMESVLRGDRQGYTIDKRFITKSQKTIFALVAARAVINSTGGTSHWVMLVQDISQRRQGEQEKEKILHQLSLKNRTLEGMLHTISHDFRHPLVNVMWYSQEIEKGVRDLTAALQEIPPELKQNLPSSLTQSLEELGGDLPHGMGEIRRGAQQLDRMLSGMLALSRLGRQPLDFVSVEMKQVLQALLDELKVHIESVKATIEMGDLPPCMGSESMLYQAWRNLFANALQFREPTRPLVIRVSGKMVRDWVVYTIEDNGIGIPASSLGHIFAPFFRLESAGSGAGEGLGLTFVTRILESHRGHIKVESELGKGTRFSVYLPKAAAIGE